MARRRPADEVGICLAADGEVQAGKCVPEPGNRWLYFIVKDRPLTEGEARSVVESVTVPVNGIRWFPKARNADPVTLMNAFQRAIDAAAHALPAAVSADVRRPGGEPMCACYFSCADDPATACSLSGDFHTHEDEPCPVHPDADVTP